MPSLKISQSAALSPDDCFERVARMFETDEDLRKLDPGFRCDFDRSKLCGTAEGQQFKAKMNISGSGQQSDIEIVVDLPLHLALVKGMVQKTLEKKLAAALA